MPLHHLSWYTFKKPPSCTECAESLTGTFRQGVHCTVCQQSYHDYCVQHDMRCPTEGGTESQTYGGHLAYRITQTKPEDVEFEEGYEHGWNDIWARQNEPETGDPPQCTYCKRVLVKGALDVRCYKCLYCENACCVSCMPSNKDNLSCVSDGEDEGNGADGDSNHSLPNGQSVIIRPSEPESESNVANPKTRGKALSYIKMGVNAASNNSLIRLSNDFDESESPSDTTAMTLNNKNLSISSRSSERQRSQSVRRYNSMPHNMGDMADEMNDIETDTSTPAAPSPQQPAIQTILKRTGSSSSLDSNSSDSSRMSPMRSLRKKMSSSGLTAITKKSSGKLVTHDRGSMRARAHSTQVTAPTRLKASVSGEDLMDAELVNHSASANASQDDAEAEVKPVPVISKEEKAAMKRLHVKSNCIESAHFFHPGPPPGMTQQQRRDIFEKRLKGRSEGTWLVRQSRGEHILTVLSGGRFWHVIIKEEERGFFYVHTGEAFQTKMELLAYYVTHQLSDTLPTRLLHCVNVNELSLYDCID